MSYEQLAVLILQGLAGGAVTAVVVSLLRRIVERIPRAAIPFVAVIVGSTVEFLTALATGDGSNPVRATLFILLAGWLRELLTTVQEHGAKP